MSDNYIIESALEAEAEEMEKGNRMFDKYRAARENWVILEAAFIAFLAGGFLGAIAVAHRQLVIVAFATGVAVGLALLSEYWRRKMHEWD